MPSGGRGQRCCQSSSNHSGPYRFLSRIVFRQFAQRVIHAEPYPNVTPNRLTFDGLYVAGKSGHWRDSFATAALRSCHCLCPASPELAARVGGSIDRNGACYGQFWPLRLQIAFSPQLLRCNFEVFAILAIRVRAVMRFFL